jgi:poly(A) polymerase
LSGERIREEFFKILISENCNDVLEVMVKSGVTQHFLPEAMQTNLTKHLIRVENFANKHINIIIDPIRRLASLISTDRSNVDAIAQRLKFSNDQYKKLKGLLVPEWEATWNIDDVSLRAGLYQFGAAYVIDLSLQQWSRMLADAPQLPKEQNDAWLRIINTANCWKDRTFPIKGQDVVNLGFAEGPKISYILKKLENWWINSGCTANRGTCLKKLRQVSLDE